LAEGDDLLRRRKTMTESTYQCPNCGGSQFTIWKLPHPIIVHWVLNPGLVANELLLGQRMPKITLICRTCPLPLIERSYIPCPHCHTLHDGRRWSGRKAFGNWLGYGCPACGLAIPCLWNVFTLVALAVTSPIWFLPYVLLLRQHQPNFGKASVPKPVKARTFVWVGAFWGLFMWICMGLTPAFYQTWQGHFFPTEVVLLQLLMWSLAGGLFGFVMWRILSRKPST
jgi:predicted RNA-binding Zn-ribbon protein involved in translation (DUF1610 family)